MPLSNSFPPDQLAIARARLARGEHLISRRSKAEQLEAINRVKAQSTTWAIGLANAIYSSDQPEQHHTPEIESETRAQQTA
jgi:hypothetical protein